MLVGDAGRATEDPSSLPSPTITAVFEGKVHPPTARKEWIGRPRLLRQVGRLIQEPVVLVAAPAGYGKTTLVAQWADRRPAGSVAWLCLDASDNDPTRLWTGVVAALDRIGCLVDANAADLVASTTAGIATRIVPSVAEALAAVEQEVVLVLDDCHVLRSGDCLDQLNLLIDALPAHAHLVLVGRSDPPLRLGRLRVEGRLGEIRTDDLGFSVEETAAVLAVEGVALSDAGLRQLLGVSEGWPAAIYLACLSLVGRDDPDAFVQRLSGSNRFIADYLSEEVLGRQDGELHDFILDMSVFDRFDVDLANFVTQTQTARRLLHRLERTNLFLISLPHEGSFRFHHLFRAFANAALEAERPDRTIELHRRAGIWYRTHGQVEDAIHHTFAAGDHEDAAQLIQANWLRYFDAGRSATVHGWLHKLRSTRADISPAATTTAAWMAALSGNEIELQGRLAALDAMTGTDPLPDGTRSPRSALVLVRGLFGFDGPDRMLADSREAVDLETNSATPWYAVARASLGYAAFVIGDRPLASAQLAEAARASAAPTTIRLLALSTLALCEAEHGNTARSASLADQAMQIATDHAMEAMPQVTFAYTAYGRSLADAGRLVEAAAALEDGLTSWRQMPGLSPWPLIHHLLQMASVAALTHNHTVAERILAEVEALTPWTDGTMDATRARIEAVRRQIAPNVPTTPVAGVPAHPPRRAAPASARGNPDAPRDRQRSLRVHQHRQNHHPVRLPQARCPLPGRGRRHHGATTSAP